jgi:hypothetical protein
MGKWCWKIVVVIVPLDLKNLIRITISRCHAVCVCVCVARTYRHTLICRKNFLDFVHVLICVWRYGNWRCIERYLKAMRVSLNVESYSKEYFSGCQLSLLYVL